MCHRKVSEGMCNEAEPHGMGGVHHSRLAHHRISLPDQGILGAPVQLQRVKTGSDLLIEHADVELAGCIHALSQHDIAADHVWVHLGVILAVPTLVLLGHLQHVHICLEVQQAW